MEAAAGISHGQVALYGASGALLWLLLVHALPVAWRATHNQIVWTATLQGVLGIVGLVVIYLALGAVAPLIVHAHAAQESVIAGLGWQGIFGQYAKPPDL